jgi:LPS-assembly protein
MRLFLTITALTTSMLAISASAHAQLLTGFDNETVTAAPASQPETSSVPAKEITDQMITDALSGPLPLYEPYRQAEPVPETASTPAYRPLITYDEDNYIHPEHATPRVPRNAEAKQQPGEDPVDLQADTLSYDEGSEVVSASGDVFLTQAGRILRADDVRYDVSKDEVVATGNVVLSEDNGDIHLSDRVSYRSKLKDGDVENLRTTLSDGAHFTADSGQRKGGIETTMQNAAYTPCVICGDEPEKAPMWGIRASEVTHNSEEARISYKNPRLEVYGVPVMYSPFFSHPDGSIEQKSGFLSPSFGYKSELGAFISNSYYWGIAPDQDATFSLMAMTEQAPLGLVEYRKRWQDAELLIDGGITTSDRADLQSGNVVQEEDELRGHIFAEAKWDVNDKWRVGSNINWASDDQYVRQYDFTDEDVLESDIYAERFAGRNYASARLIAFQDVRVRANRVEDQPEILPEIIASFIGEPGAVPLVKGRWSVDTSILGLRREGKEQDVTRYSLDAGWKRRLVSDYGFLTNIEASVRGDAYYTNDRENADNGSGVSSSGTDVRAFPQVHIESSYPMAREFETMQASFEPVFALTAAPDIDVEDDRNIPNEDSNDVQIDSSNLFNSNRFPGLDRIEDQSRVTYGLRTGLHGYDGSHAKMFIGQSYRLDDQNNPFPSGSGLNNQESDIVGQFSANYQNRYTLDYRYQLNSQTLTSERHEVDFNADWNRFRLGGEYLYASALEGTELDESREQFNAASQLYLTPSWRMLNGATYDFGENEGLRKVYTGMDYLGQCLFFSLIGQKNFTNDVSGESSTEVLFRIGLKNLGDFEETAYRSDAPQRACTLFN